jgi:regulatory protein
MKDQYAPENLPEWIVAKMKHYCAFQERSIFEVKTKLKTFRLQENVFDAIINHLIDENYLNEERFAKAFVSDKFRLTKWGKNKIYLALQQKRVPELFILQALGEISEEEYLSGLRQLIAKKSRELTEKDFRKRNHKLANFAISRGFEPTLVWKVLEYRE